MNTRKNMIIIKGEIKTSEIKFCKYNVDTKKMDVEFKNGKIYSYLYSSVEWLKEPKALNPNMYLIKCQGHNLFDVDAIYVFEGMTESYWHICFADGSERDYVKSELKITESCLNQKQAGNVFEYIKQVAGLCNIKNEETGEKILLQRFEKITFVGGDVALAKYLNPSTIKRNKTNFLKKRKNRYSFKNKRIFSIRNFKHEFF